MKKLILISVFAALLIICGASFGNAFALDECEHSFTCEKVNAGCEKEGMKTYICTLCEYTYSEVLPAKGHLYKRTTTPASCTKDGKKVYKCSRCDSSYTEKITAKGHSYKCTVTPASCTKDGKKVYKCSRCDSTYTEKITAKGHSYKCTTTPASCTKDGKKVYKCSRCDSSYTEKITAKGHSYKCTVTPASCMKDGKKVYKCSRCDSSYTEKITAKGHNKKTVNKAATYFENGYNKRKLCADCGKVLEKGTVINKKTLASPVKITASSYDSKSVKISFGSVKAATGYRIFRRAQGEEKYSPLTETEKISFVDSSVKCGIRYKYAVYAYVKSGKKTAFSSPSMVSIVHMPCYGKNEGFEESPVGATVWAVFTQNVYADSSMSKISGTWYCGNIGKIIKSENGMFEISYTQNGKQKSGFVRKYYLLINLPQVIPSITYDIYNCYYSRYPIIRNGQIFNIPQVSGKNLYGGRKVLTTTNMHGTVMEWIVPCHYLTAKKLVQAQKNALSNGDTIKVIDTYRSVTRTRQTYNAVINSGYAGYISPSVGVFLASGYSNHNKGICVDCSLIKLSTGAEYKMQTTYNLMVPQTYICYNNANANRLQRYMRAAGFTPFECEWYHFTDYSASDYSTYLYMSYPVNIL